MPTLSRILRDTTARHLRVSGAAPPPPDPPPTAPSTLTATFTGVATVALSWPADGTGVSYFLLERSADGGATYPTSFSLGASATSYSDTTANYLIQYVYRLTAYNSAGTDDVSATTTLPSAPSAPSSLSATPDETTIDLAWTDNSANELGFEVYRSLTGSSGWTLLTTTAANVTSYEDAGLDESTTYYYRVRATGLGGNSSYATANATTTTATPTAILSRSDFALLGAFRVPTTVNSTAAIGNPDNGGGLALRRVAGQVRLFTWLDASLGSGNVYEFTPPAGVGTAVGTRPQDGPGYTQGTLVRYWGDVAKERIFNRVNGAYTDQTGTIVSATATTITFSKDVAAGGTVPGRFVGITSGARAGKAARISAYNAGTRTATISAAWPFASLPEAGDPFRVASWVNGTVERHGLAWDETDQRLYWSYGVAYGGKSDNPSYGFSVLNDGDGTVTAYGPFGRFCQFGQGGVVMIPAAWAATYAPGKRLGVGFGGYYSTFVGSIGCAMRAVAKPGLTQQNLDFSVANDNIPSVGAAVAMNWVNTSTVRGPRTTSYENTNIFLAGSRCAHACRDATARSLQGPARLVPFISPWVGVVDSGSKAAVTSGTNVVTITSSVNLASVPTDGTVPLWISKSSTSTSIVECSPITAISGSAPTWTVTTRDNWAWSGSGLRMILGGNPNSQAYPTFAPKVWGFKATTNGTSAVAVTHHGSLSAIAGKSLWVGTGGNGTESFITAVAGTSPNWTVTCTAAFPAAANVSWAADGGLRVKMTSGAASGEARRVLAWVAGDPAGATTKNTFLLDRAWSSVPAAADTYTVHKNTATAGAATSITLPTGGVAGWKVEIVLGTGAGQIRTIAAYNSTTRVASVSAWDTVPDATSVYNTYRPGTAAGDVAIDHSGGFGRWTWADYLAGNSCVWIDGATKSGVVYFPSLATGCVVYYEAAIWSDGHEIAAMVFDPDELGAAASGAQAATYPTPKATWAMSDDIPEFTDDDSPDPRSGGGGYCNTRGHQIPAAVYDPVDRRLYVLMQRGWTGSDGKARPTVYVFSVDA